MGNIKSFVAQLVVRAEKVLSPTHVTTFYFLGKDKKYKK